MFDISHMGEVTVSGPGALAWLESLLTNRVGKLAVTRGQYTLMLDESGGVIDDLIIYRTGEMSYFLVINGACRDLDLEWMRSRLPADGSVLLEDQGNDYAAIALQGPDSEIVLRGLYPFCDIPKRNGIAALVTTDGEIPSLLARTGYTGEDGIEVAVPNEKAEQLLAAIVAAGVTPAGLGARDTLRLEAALPLYGHELTLSSTTLEARLGWVLGWAKETFRGRAAVEAERDRGVARLLTGVVADGRQPLRDGADVVVDGASVGTLCSGNFSPVLERGIGLGLLSGNLEIGTPVTVVLRGREIPATITSLPFVRKAK